MKLAKKKEKKGKETKEEKLKKKEEKLRKKKEEKEKKKQAKLEKRMSVRGSSLSLGPGKELSMDSLPQHLSSGDLTAMMTDSGSHINRHGSTKSGSKRKRPKGFKETAFQQTLEHIRNNMLKVVNMANWNLDKAAASELAKALEVNSSVVELNLSANMQIGDEGIIPLARMLEKNKTITTLDIVDIGITRKGTRHLLTCLNNNVFITKLFVDEQGTDLGGMFNVGEASLNPITEEVRENIDKILESNAKFRDLLEGRTQVLDLSDREQSFVNTHILEKFPNLTVIDLSYNKLEDVPECIGKLKCLKYMNLSHNRITTLPTAIGALPELIHLDLRHNALSELPHAITNLPKLKVLKLSHNRFNNLPRFSLGSMPTLEILEIRDNPLREISSMGYNFKHVIAQGGRETINYIREYNQGFEEVYRMKLMFVGNGNVGKTTLLRNFTKKAPPDSFVGPGTSGIGQTSGKLKTKTAQPVGYVSPDSLENVATDGIDIRNWNVKLPDKETYLTFSCWDFAGQEVYYATHGFFLTQRAIYLVVFDLTDTEQNTQIEYWLQSVHARTENPIVILVGTHVEDKRCAKDGYVEKYFQQIYDKYERFRGSIVTHFAVSNMTDKNIPELKQKIVEIALEQPYMPDRIANSFLALEERMRGLQQTCNPPTISWEQYAEICTNEAKIKEEHIMTATRFLNDLGSLVYFSEKEAGLRDIVIVDPQWITKTFATVVSLNFGFVKNGILAYKDLPQLWKPPSHPPELHDKLIALLEKFQVISKLQLDGETKILIPCMLPDAPPDEQEMEKYWPLFEENVPQVGRIYNFEFVPLGFFSRLIVKFLSSDYIPVLYWQKGIVLQKGTERIKLIIHQNSREETKAKLPVCLELWVRGPRPARHLGTLVGNIDTLVMDWLRVKFEITVPCTHCIKEGSDDPYQFPMKLVEQTVAAGGLYVICRGIKNVLVENIAPDIAMSEFKGAKVDYSELKIIKQIGEGGFAKVYKATWNDKIIALKELILDASNTTQAIGFEFEDATDPLAVFAEFRREVALMSEMSHPNIVSLMGLCMYPFCMLLEFCSLGCLYDYIHDEKRVLNWPVIVKLAEDIAKGMRFMHNFNPPLIHRDLKSPNVLLTVEMTESGPTIVAKVADFGLSRSLLLASKLNLKVVDNPVWLAPEMMRKEDYDEKVDVYSFGVILWELVSRGEFLGHITFLSAIEDAVLQGERPDIPEDCLKRFPEFASLIQSCWDGDPEKRPTFTQVCEELAQIREKRLPTTGEKMPSFAMPSTNDDSSFKHATQKTAVRNFEDVPQPPPSASARANKASSSTHDASSSMATVGAKSSPSFPLRNNKPERSIATMIPQSRSQDSIRSPDAQKDANQRSTSTTPHKQPMRIPPQQQPQQLPQQQKQQPPIPSRRGPSQTQSTQQPPSERTTHSLPAHRAHNAQPRPTVAPPPAGVDRKGSMPVLPTQHPQQKGTQSNGGGRVISTTTNASRPSSPPSSSSGTSSTPPEMQPRTLLSTPALGAGAYRLGFASNGDLSSTSVTSSPAPSSSLPSPTSSGSSIATSASASAALKRSTSTRQNSGGWLAVEAPSRQVRLITDEVPCCLLDRMLPSKCSAGVTSMIAWRDRVWCGCKDGTAFLWDNNSVSASSSPSLIKSWQMHRAGAVTALCVVQDACVWSCSSKENRIAIWDENGNFLSEISTKFSPSCMLEMRFPKDKEGEKVCNFVWVGGKAAKKVEIGVVTVWDSAALKLKKTIKLERDITEVQTILEGKATRPKCFLYHGNHIYVAHGARIYCFDPINYVLKGYLGGHLGKVRNLISVGKEVWSGADDKFIKVWNPEEAGSECLYTLEGHCGQVRQMVHFRFKRSGGPSDDPFAADDGSSDSLGCVWSCGWDKKILLWDAQTHQFVKWLQKKHEASINCLCEAPQHTADKKSKLWSAADDGSICVWK